MLVFINRKPVYNQAWGGGSKVLESIIKALEKAGHTVTHQLVPNIDVLFCFDPRPDATQGLVGYDDIYRYSRDSANVKTKLGTGPERPRIIQRVGDVGSHGKPDLTRLVITTTMKSDTVIFPSMWAYDFVQHTLAINDKRPINQWHVIANAPKASFFKHRKLDSRMDKPLSFVSHHWSDNKMKGHSTYQAIEEFLVNQGHEFTFIGRQPNDVKLKGAKEPMTETQLIEELPKHDVYVTASLAEAGANHVLEAIAAGLPVIYHMGGGSINEYCANYGISFDGTLPSFQKALEHLKVIYPKLQKNIKKYRTTIDDQATKYVGIIEALRA